MKLNEIKLGSKQHAELVAKYQASQKPQTQVQFGDLKSKLEKSTLPQKTVDGIIEVFGKDTKPTVMIKAEELMQACTMADCEGDAQEVFDLVGMKWE